MGFDSWKDFHDFEQEVKFKNRYIHPASVIKFLNDIKSTLPSRERILSSQKILYRAQIGYEEDEHEGEVIIRGFNKKRMKPIPESAQEGRANAKGILYLYLSNDERTSLAETRPHLGQLVSLAQFKVQRTLRLVDCYSVPHHYSFAELIFNPPKSQEEIESAIWSMINEAFSRPITNADHRSDYVPTQILAEWFKAEGFDGLCFKSSLGPGYNFIFFKLEDAELVNCGVAEVKAISYEYDECANRYHSREKHNK